jgi:hypothetical protein
MRFCSTGESCPVSADAVAQFRPASIALVLDTSGSMRCGLLKDGSSVCDCLLKAPPNDCDSLYAGNQRIDALKAAVGQFVSFFNPNRDRMSIVPFNIVADSGGLFSLVDASDAPAPFGATQSRYDAFFAKVQGLVPHGNTNTCDGLRTALADMDRASPRVLDQDETFFVLFSDGAPTAGRFGYTQPKQPLLDLMAAGYPNDWVQYVISWLDSSNNRWTGPSPLVQYTSMPFNYAQRGTPPSGSVLCGSVESDPALYGNTMQPCAQSLEFGTGVGQATSFSDYVQQYYDCAIEESDHIRERRSWVFAIGLGPPALPGTNDPYANVNDDFSRKEGFLRLLSGDLYHGQSDPPFGPSRLIPVNDPSDQRYGTSIAVGYDEYKDYPELLSAPGFLDHQGEYHGTDNAYELNYLFTRVAKTILMRMIR